MDGMCGIEYHFYVSGWIFLSKKKSIAGWSSAGSLAFVALTLLMQYRMVLNWVNAEDWSALLDVVPSIFPILTGYGGYHAFSQCRSDCFRSKKHKVQVILKPCLHNQQTGCNQHLQ